MAANDRTPTSTKHDPEACVGCGNMTTDDPSLANAPTGRRGRRQRPSGNPPAKPKSLHGRRKGKTLRRVPAGLVEQLLPSLAIDLSFPLADPATLFPHAVREVRLEIGFGGGEHLAAEAVRNPDVGFLGCEPFINGVAKALHAVGEHDLDNVRIHVGDAMDLVDALPRACLARVDLLYPDPWPKRRHRGRRFVSDSTLTRLARSMRPGAELRFATDIDDYAGWALARILRSRDFEWQARSASEWTTSWEHWPGTRYEHKALAQGRRPVYLTFRCSQT